MGCGKSKHRSLEDSEIDTKHTNKNSNHGNNKNGGSSSNSGGGGTNAGGGGNSSSSGSGSGSKKDNNKDSSSGSSGKKKKHFNDNKTSHKDGDKDEKSSPFKLLTNGKSNRTQASGGRSEEVGVPAGLSASGKTNGSGGGEKSNGTLSANKQPYALDIPNEISKPETHQKTTCRDFKSLTSSKTVHVTSSQIEFFKMLDEKIEKGDGYTTSADVSEVSSLDENFRH